MSKPRMAITGSHGFLGSSLIKRFGDSHTIISVDRALLAHPSALEQFLKDSKPDYIIHCAAYGNFSFQKGHEEIFAANVVGTFNLLNASKDIPYKAFINIGSSSEYGHKFQPMDEYDVPETSTFYGTTKVAATYLSRAFGVEFKKPIVTIRPFSVYGEGEAAHKLIPTAIAAALTDTVMPFGNGTATHDWIYIEDFLNALELVMENAPKLSGHILNIGTSKAYTDNQIVSILATISGKAIKLDRGAYPMASHHSPYWRANNHRLELLGWTQQYSIQEGLKRVYDYQKKLYYIYRGQEG